MDTVGSGDSGFVWEALRASTVPVVLCPKSFTVDVKTHMSPKTGGVPYGTRVMPRGQRCSRDPEGSKGGNLQHRACMFPA